MNRKSLGWLIAVVLIGAGCANDRTLDDFRREKSQQEIAKLTPILGDYVGELTRERDGSRIGTLVFSLGLATDRSAAKDLPTTQEQVSLQGSLTLEESGRDELRQIRFLSSYFDSKSGELRTTVQINLRDGGSTVIQIAAAIKDDQATGYLEEMGNRPSRARFKLRRDSVSQGVGRSEGRERSPDKDPAPQLGSFAQVYAASSSGSGKWKLSVIRVVTPAQSFLEPFARVRPVDVTLVADGAVVSLLFPNALWDDQNRHFIGEGRIENASSNRTVLECQEVDLADQPSGLICTYYAQNNQFIFDRLLFAPVARVRK